MHNNYDDDAGSISSFCSEQQELHDLPTSSPSSEFEITDDDMETVTKS